MGGLYDRAQQAGAGIAEALAAIGQPSSTPLAPTPQPLAAPPGAVAVQRPGALQGPQQMMQRPSPLQMMPDFRSPPVAAALQGAVGAQGPVGFARGGLAVFPEGRR